MLGAALVSGLVGRVGLHAGSEGKRHQYRQSCLAPDPAAGEQRQSSPHQLVGVFRLAGRHRPVEVLVDRGSARHLHSSGQQEADVRRATVPGAGRAARVRRPTAKQSSASGRLDAVCQHAGAAPAQGTRSCARQHAKPGPTPLAAARRGSSGSGTHGGVCSGAPASPQPSWCLGAAAAPAPSQRP